jgi:hypothetical protein
MPRSAKLFPDAVPIVGLVACTVLALSLRPATILTGLVVLVVGFALRAGVRGGRW